MFDQSFMVNKGLTVFQKHLLSMTFSISTVFSFFFYYIYVPLLGIYFLVYLLGHFYFFAH